MQSVSPQSAKKLVASWLSEESTYHFFGYGIDSSKNALVVSLNGAGVLAGVPFVDALVEHVGCSIEWHVKEGEVLSAGDNKIATITGAPVDLVHAELLVKNILSRASSIATFATRLKKLLTEFSWNGELVSPFIHTPGFALVEEYSAFVAGIPSSRNPSSVFLPQSHIQAIGSVKEAISAIKLKMGKNTQVTVECSALEDAKAAVDAGATCIRFEGTTAKDLANFSTQLKSASTSILVETSGNFNETTMRQFALPNVDSLTTKKLFNGYPTLNFTVNFEASTKPVSQKRPAATAESERPSSVDNGVKSEKEHAPGPESDSDSTKRIKLEPATPVSVVRQQKKVLVPQSTKKVTPPVAQTQKRSPEKSNGSANRANANKARQQQQYKNQRFNNNRPPQNLMGRGEGSAIGQQRRNDNRMPQNASCMGGGPRSMGSMDAGHMMPMRVHQNPQQQAASAFLQQARMMNNAFVNNSNNNPVINPPRSGPTNNSNLMSAAAAAALLSVQRQHRQQPPPQDYRGGGGGGTGPMVLAPRGSGGGPMARPGGGLQQPHGGGSVQWSIMGGPPAPPPHPRGGGAGFFQPCRVCGFQLAPGMPFCRNCRAPAR